MLWPNEKSAAFMRSREQYGKLSNMTGGFPISLHGLLFSGTEAVYQALKFPYNIDAQYAIAGAANGMSAKKIAYKAEYKDSLRDNWNDVRVTAMKIALLLKYVQHKTVFKHALDEN